MPAYLFSGIAILLVALAVLALVSAFERAMMGAHRRRIERCEEVRHDVDFARWSRDQKLTAERFDFIRGVLMGMLPVLLPSLIAYFTGGEVAEVPGAAPDAEEDKIADLLRHAAESSHRSGARPAEPGRGPGSKETPHGPPGIAGHGKAVGS